MLKPKGKKILIIEGDEANRKKMKELFQKYGYTVTTADSGGNGTQQAERELPHLIAIKMRLPDHPGEMIAQKIKARVQGAKDVPIILYSKLLQNYTPDQVQDTCQKSGIEDYADSDEPIEVLKICEGLYKK